VFTPEDLALARASPGAAVMRGLQSASLRRDGTAEPAVLDALRDADAALSQQLRRPGEDRAMRFALFPVAAVIVD
jgi:hypothetical protein